jgi:hypothetical protein
MTGYDPTQEYDRHEDEQRKEEEAARIAAMSVREFNIWYKRKMEKETAAFRAHVAEVGVENLDRAEFIRYRRLQTGDVNYGRRGY